MPAIGRERDGREEAERPQARRTVTQGQDSQMNVRIAREQKLAGDAVLARYGITPSEAVRALWSYLAQTGELPDFLRSDAADDHAAKLLAFRQLVLDSEGLAVRLAHDPGQLIDAVDAFVEQAGDAGDPYSDLHEEAYDEKLARYLSTADALADEREAGKRQA